jgi:hypothetical protein
MSAQGCDDLAFSKMRRRSLLSSASVRKEQPSSFALRLVMASDRFRAIEARSGEAPEATIAFRRSMSLSDQGFFPWHGCNPIMREKARTILGREKSTLTLLGLRGRKGGETRHQVNHTA